MSIKIKVFILFFLFFSKLECKKLFTVMICPEGSYHYAGRTIEDYFERGITIQLSNAIKESIEQLNKNLRIIITKTEGQKVECDFCQATFSNRLESDFYLHIGVYHSKTPSIDIVLFNQHNFQINQLSGLQFTPFEKAHFLNFEKTEKYANLMKNFLIKNSINVKGPNQIPLKSLSGIIAPAISIELGLQNQNEAKEYVEIISRSIIQIFESNKNE